jgi:ubiquitin carboxyl-terminal hydrolase 7
MRKHHGFDLADTSRIFSESLSYVPPRRIRRDITFSQFKEDVATELGLLKDQVRVWTLTARQNKTIRLDEPVSESVHGNEVVERVFRNARQDDGILVFIEVSQTMMDLPSGTVRSKKKERELVVVL